MAAEQPSSKRNRKTQQSTKQGKNLTTATQKPPVEIYKHKKSLPQGGPALPRSHQKKVPKPVACKSRTAKAPAPGPSKRVNDQVATIDINQPPSVPSSVIQSTEVASAETLSLHASRASVNTAEPAEWYTRWGYEPPEEDMTTSITNSSRPTSEHPARSRKSRSPRVVTYQADTEYFRNGLRERGIIFNPSKDHKIDEIRKLVLAARPKVSTTQDEKFENGWKADLVKCAKQDEALIQRTIMMETIDRYELGELLDYTCESVWTCKRMPRKPPKHKAAVTDQAVNDNQPGKIKPIIELMAKPRPDLYVAFKLEAIMPESSLPLLEDLKGYICPESSKKEGSDDRAFPFFSMETKSSQAAKGEPVANRQNFNTASQALHNIYEFMKKADRLNTFLKEVRFFSATVTASTFQVRVHRAVIADKKDKIQPDYPLGFRFDEVFQSEQKPYTRAEITRIIKNILFEYGVKKLLPILKNAVEEVLEMLWQEDQTPTPPSGGKRPAQEELQSFGSSQRQRLDDIDINDDTSPLSSQAALA